MLVTSVDRLRCYSRASLEPHIKRYTTLQQWEEDQSQEMGSAQASVHAASWLVHPPPRPQLIACDLCSVQLTTRTTKTTRTEPDSEDDIEARKLRAEEVAALLIAPTCAAGAVDAADNDGVSSLMAARKNGLDGVVKMLLSADAKPHQTYISPGPSTGMLERC